MVLQLLGGLLLIVSCGKQVSIDHTALKDASQLQTKESNSLQKGVISKIKSTGNNYLLYNDFSYKVSENSSLLSKRFIEELPAGQTHVLFKGKVLKEEIVISEISKK